jgi:hypothetical protein
MMQDGFGLIVGGVAGGDVASADLLGGRNQKVVSLLTGLGFRDVRPKAGWVRRGRSNDTFQLQIATELLHERLVSIRLGSTKLMVEVSDRKSGSVRL